MSDDRLMEVVADLEDRLEDVRMDLESEKDRNDRLEERLRATIDDLVDERNRVDRLESQLQSERDRVDELEDELASERRRRRGLERRLAKFDREQENVHDAIGRKTDAMNDRIASLEDDRVDAEDVIGANPTENLLPIQQLYNTVKAGGADTMDANEERAARVWPHFRDYADPSGGRLTLTSTKVRDILDRELGIDHPNPNTVKRVMVFLERFSGRDEDSRIIRMDASKKTNRLVCDRDDWIEATGKMMDAARKNGAERAMTDGGGD